MITRIEDGYATTVGCEDGALVELQCVDETTSVYQRASLAEKHRTWELLWSRGDEATMHHLTVKDVRSLGAALAAFADVIEAKGGRA